MADISGSTDLGGFLSSIFTGAIGAGQLFGGGSQSVTGSAAAGAAAANPFGSQFGAYQPQLQTAISGQGGNISAAGSNIAPIIQQLLGMHGNATGTAMAASPGNLGTQINDLATNYMNNPAIQAQYKLGLDTVNSGLAATGGLASGKQMLELEKYGQQFASNAYQQQFQNLLSGNAQQFSQGATLQQLLAGELGTAGGLQNSASGLQISGQGNLIQQLLSASGATTGSPATAGGILSGQFANSQQAAANLGSGLSGALSRLLGSNGGSLPNVPGLSNFINSLIGGGGADAAIGSLGGAASFLGDTGIGGLGSTAGDYLGSSIGGAYDMGSFGSFGSDLGGIFSGFNGGAAGSAAAGGAADVGAAGAAGAGAGAEAGGAAGAGVGGIGAGALTGFGMAGAVVLGGMLLSALGGNESPNDFAQLNLNNPAQAFTPSNSLYGSFANIFGNGGAPNTAASVAQGYQTLLSDLNSPSTMAQLFSNTPYAGENNPITNDEIARLGQYFVNTPSLWNIYQGQDPAQINSNFYNMMQNIGVATSG